jgi:hypothetical protein
MNYWENNYFAFFAKSEEMEDDRFLYYWFISNELLVTMKKVPTRSNFILMKDEIEYNEILCKIKNVDKNWGILNGNYVMGYVISSDPLIEDLTNSSFVIIKINENDYNYKCSLDNLMNLKSLIRRIKINEIIE